MHTIKTFCILLIACLMVSMASGQTNKIARLAIISESSEVRTAADVLTAELSNHKGLQLVERDQVTKVYREQALSAGNHDYLKLGRMLGADGLLLLGTSKEVANNFLNVRLIAVKPGAVLAMEQFPYPKNLSEWASQYAGRIIPLLPKLTILARDAIPISVVNLRSALQFEASKETEWQLKYLAIQRLSREPRLFVLEREKMQLLDAEKDLKLDDSAFWNGSYLLEGTIDQNGYSQKTITVNARLIPPHGGKPLPIAVEGSRTNLTEVINRLAGKINAALNVSPSSKEWSAADEARQFFDEAKWARS